MGFMLVSEEFMHTIYSPSILLDAINNAGGKINATAGVFATFPTEYLTIGNGFLDQVIIPHFKFTIILLVFWNFHSPHWYICCH